MADLLHVREIRVPTAVCAAVHEHLRELGELRYEGVGFWAGRDNGDVFEVMAAVVPGQRTGRTEAGLAVIVSGDELFRMNVWLRQQQMTLIAQVHSHPDEAYHSATDDELAVMSRCGGLSIVVPGFAQDPFDLDRVAVYRMDREGLWCRLSRDDVAGLIQMVE